jgi:hypothetical protein
LNFFQWGKSAKYRCFSLPYKLTENAMEAAKKIKFEPAVEDDNAITVNKIIEYVYSYGGWQNSSSKYENNKKDDSKTDEKAEAIIKRAVENLGGEKYLRATSQIGRGRYSILARRRAHFVSIFVDVIVFPDKERTEFKTGGAKNVQTNNGGEGWISTARRRLSTRSRKNRLKITSAESHESRQSSARRLAKRKRETPIGGRRQPCREKKRRCKARFC